MDKPFYNVRVVKTQISAKTVNLKYCVFEKTGISPMTSSRREKRGILKKPGFVQKCEKFGISPKMGNIWDFKITCF